MGLAGQTCFESLYEIRRLDRHQVGYESILRFFRYHDLKNTVLLPIMTFLLF